jgi:hypothetical protein
MVLVIVCGTTTVRVELLKQLTLTFWLIPMFPLLFELVPEPLPLPAAAPLLMAGLSFALPLLLVMAAWPPVFAPVTCWAAIGEHGPVLFPATTWVGADACETAPTLELLLNPDGSVAAGPGAGAAADGVVLLVVGVVAAGVVAAVVDAAVVLVVPAAWAEAVAAIRPNETLPIASVSAPAT